MKNVKTIAGVYTGNLKNIRKRQNEKGITLIALVITIIVLLILAGITIATLTGENGLFARAKEAKEKASYSQAEEKVKLAVNASYDNNANLNKDMLKENLNKIDGINPKVEKVEFDLKVTVDGYEFIITVLGEVIAGGKEEELPENTPSTDAGTEVKPNDKWNHETVYGVSDGEGNTIPVPYGFFYVGGSFSTGVIISDNEEDKYDGKTDKTTHEYSRILKGNQFVFIPCTSDEYKKCNIWNGTTQNESNLSNTNWDTTTSSTEIEQIKQYGGFFVGRYEAGLATTIQEFTTTQEHTGSNQIYNKNGIPQSKAGQISWIFIDWIHAKENAEIMYNTKSIKSGLITGTQWDVILNKLVEKTDLESGDLTSPSKWGNYRNVSTKYKGRLAKLYYSSGWYLPVFGMNEEGTTNIYEENTYANLLTTGAGAITDKYHLYDLAGNVWEYTEENSNNIKQDPIVRGGSFAGLDKEYPVCYRNATDRNYTAPDVGFRIVLYIK